MISYSDEKLPAIGMSRGKKIVRYNFKETLASGENPGGWQFEQVAVPADAGRAELIDAMIGQRYSKADEIALINNASINNDGAGAYATYQAFRVQAKAWAVEALI